MKSVSSTLLILILVSLISCTSIPNGASPIRNFEKSQYLGSWYEIARLDHSFEKDLEQVTATYTIKDDESISVLNQGYNVRSKKIEQAEGIAKFAQGDSIGQLKVSFFGPFYGGYNIISVDSNYNYALVAGNNLNYLWLLSRKPTMSQSMKDKYLHMAKNIGYDIDKLVWVNQKPITAQQ